MSKIGRKKLQTYLCMRLAIALILCLFSMLYGFYRFVRYANLLAGSDMWGCAF